MGDLNLTTTMRPTRNGSASFRGHQATPFGSTLLHQRSGRAIGSASALFAKQSSPSMKLDRVKQIVISMMLVAASFYAGILVGMHASCSSSGVMEEVIRQRVAEELVERRSVEVSKQGPNNNQQQDNIIISKKKQTPSFFSSKIVAGISKTDRNEFLSHFDYGLPQDQERHSSEVIVLYSDSEAMPNSLVEATATNKDIPVMGALEATENCDKLKVVVAGKASGPLHQCIAVIEGVESFHIQNWMRMSTTDVYDKSYPLRHVGRGMQANGVNTFIPPKTNHIEQNWKLLRNYLGTVDDVLTRLRPIAKRIARNNTIVVMVCNLGQSSLLVNFACAARSKGLDLSGVLVFCTDEETLGIARGLGFAAFYDEKNFAAIPLSEAKTYGDKTFAAVMHAKVITVQLINKLGYDCLFQDVDIVWYRDPLPLFHDKSSSLMEFDILFQDDGARSLRYSPFCSNSGFYYVRYNSRTEYFFTSLLYATDLVLSTHSHQQALTALLADHASLFGLRIKTLNEDDLPGGHYFHRKSTFMHEMLEGKRTPFLFHMSWTKK